MSKIPFGQLYNSTAWNQVNPYNKPSGRLDRFFYMEQKKYNDVEREKTYVTQTDDGLKVKDE